MKTYHTFKTVENFQKFLRTKYQNCKHTSGCLDYVNVNGTLYTMHEYDMNGQNVTWANKKKELMLENCTNNKLEKHGNPYADSLVSEYPAYYLRTDINYAE